MTEEILAVLPPHRAERLRAAADAFSRALRLPVGYRSVPLRPDALVAALDDPQVSYGVLPHEAGRLARVVDEVIQRTDRPVVVVPTASHRACPDIVSRVLVPLDGTREAAEAMQRSLQTFAGLGVDVLVLHVIDGGTAPPFWDQPAHAQSSWEREFRARYCDVPNARVELRSGAPGVRIVDVADAEDVDLIALGWRQRFAGRHAAAVRAVLDQTAVPVLLIPSPVRAVNSLRDGSDPVSLRARDQ